MNLANRLTMSRILLTFVFMFFLFCNGLWPKAISLVVLLSLFRPFVQLGLVGPQVYPEHLLGLEK